MSDQNKKPGPEPISEQGLADLRAEIEQLETEGRQDMAARIKAARELGDLKENAEYHIAKDDQAHLETKIKRLRFQLQNAEVIEVDTKADTFAFGRTAEIRDEDSGKVHTWTLVGGAEADLAAGRISVEARSAPPCATRPSASRSRSGPRAARGPTRSSASRADARAARRVPGRRSRARARLLARGARRLARAARRIRRLRLGDRRATVCAWAYTSAAPVPATRAPSPISRSTTSRRPWSGSPSTAAR